MVYRSKHNHFKKQKFGFIWGLLIIFFVILFIYAVYCFRSESQIFPLKKNKAEENSYQDSPLLSSIEENSKEIEDLEKADLKAMTKKGGSAIATRQLEKGIFFHTLKSHLPAIDRNHFFYEGWLVRQVPFDYFSTGELKTNNLGEFILKFQGDPKGDYKEYTQIVITLEVRDDNPDPNEHILEGEFNGEIFDQVEAVKYWETFYPVGLDEDIESTDEDEKKLEF